MDNQSKILVESRDITIYKEIVKLSDKEIYLLKEALQDLAPQLTSKSCIKYIELVDRAFRDLEGARIQLLRQVDIRKNHMINEKYGTTQQIGEIGYGAGG